ncbi:MAG: hypothetical protein ACM359_03900 [Bacillota bacterium]
MGEEQSAAIDWGKVEEEILCPLCDYNLRGLGEAKCPECGYRFEWADLIDPERRRHPYLFEHHPRHKVWAFWKTMVGGVRPRRFWTSLKPGQPSHRGWLILYAVLASVIALMLPLVFVGFGAVEAARAMVRERDQHIAAYSSIAAADTTFRRQYPNQQAWARTMYAAYPRPLSGTFFRELLSRSKLWGLLIKIVEYTVFIVIWPWLTFLFLMIFVISMRRAHVRRIHVMRCVVYCGDAGVWLVIGAAIVGVLCSVAMTWISANNQLGFWMEFGSAAGAAIFLIVFAYRLAMAYRYYLKFDYPVATVVSSQVIAIMFAMIVLSVTDQIAVLGL